jgi:hypothetical protein
MWKYYAMLECFVILILNKAKVISPRATSKWWLRVTLDITYVSLDVNDVHMSTIIFEEIVAPWDLWPNIPYVRGNINIALKSIYNELCLFLLDLQSIIN